MSTKTYLLSFEKDTKKLAITLAEFVSKGHIILLEGNLGAGKSTFARYFIQSLMGEATEVPSPTFTLLQTYEAEKFFISHFDLYRIKDPMEISELGLDEAFASGVTLIEWPERLGPYMPKNPIILRFEEKNDQRWVHVSGVNLVG
ncbi:MAG: tRNA (adenosine(37)-N6)-threonylcarbamoyltransferase complex ATPase subunit type 1 TsaE [Alphaproteobacteria bacterium]